MRWRRGAAWVGATAALVGAAGCAGPVRQSDVAPKRYVETPTVSAGATAAYGPAAEQAYREVADFLIDESAPAALLDPRHAHAPTVGDLSDGITDHLAPRTAAAWTRHAEQAVAGDEDARDIVRLLRLFAVDAPGLSLPDDGSVVESQTVSEGRVDVVTPDGPTGPTGPTGAAGSAGPATPRLRITLEHDTRLRFLDGRTPSRATVTAPLTFVVVPRSAAPSEAASSSASGANAAPVGDVTPTSAGHDVHWVIERFEGESSLDFDNDGLPSSDATAAS